MIDSLIKTPVRYFDENPSGRILNRFTSDMGLMDLVWFYILSDALGGMFHLLNCFLFIVIINVWILIPSSIILVILIKWVKYNK